MWLIIQIALGMLLGFILIKNYKSLKNLAIGAAYIIFGLALLGLIWLSFEQLNSAINNYSSAGEFARNLFNALVIIIFMALGVSTLLGTWTFVMVIIPNSFLEWMNRSQDSNILLNISAAFLTGSIIYLCSYITLPGFLGDWYDSWTAWGQSHGMGYDGGDFFGMLLWQIIWPINVGILRLQKRSIADFIKNFRNTIA